MSRLLSVKGYYGNFWDIVMRLKRKEVEKKGGGMWERIKIFLMEDVGEDFESGDGVKINATKVNENIQIKIAKRITSLMLLSLLGFLMVVIFLDNGHVQRYGAILAIVGIVSEFIVVRKSQTVVEKDCRSNDYIVSEFTRKRIVNWLHYVAIGFTIIGSIIWAYCDVLCR